MTTALMMAGGRAVRMRAGGCALHKALRIVGDAPLIEWSLSALKNRGLSQVFVSLSSQEPDLFAWMTRHRERMSETIGAEVTLMVETEPLGTIGAVALLPANVSEVLVVNVDNLTNLDLVALVSAHRDSGDAATIACHDHEFRLPFGRLELSGRSVAHYAEKPLITTPVSSGTYVLSRSAMDLVPRGTRMDVPQLIVLLLEQGARVGAHRHAATWLDVNDEDSLARAATLAAAMLLCAAEPGNTLV